MRFDPIAALWLGSGFALMVTTGYKAGLVLGHLPQEARHASAPGVDARWLAANLRAWADAQPAGIADQYVAE